MIFCFKQKTAYEMRISDWSSDVCSSDLIRRQKEKPGYIARRRKEIECIPGDRIACHPQKSACRRRNPPTGRGGDARTRLCVQYGRRKAPCRAQPNGGRHRSQPHQSILRRTVGGNRSGRSEEHTSELQSLTRIS